MLKKTKFSLLFAAILAMASFAGGALAQYSRTLDQNRLGLQAPQLNLSQNQYQYQYQNLYQSQGQDRNRNQNQYQYQYQLNTFAPTNIRTGTVAAVSGNTITMNSRVPVVGGGATTTQYAVDAANAKIYVNNATTTIAAIVVGDTISVRGTLGGTTITATEIRKIDNIGDDSGQRNTENRGIPQLMVAGQLFIGTVSTVNGSMITMGNVQREAGGATTTIQYTVDAATAKVFVNNATTTVAGIAAGDKISVRGTLSGTTITAAQIWKGNYMGGAVSQIRGEQNQIKQATSTYNGNFRNWRSDPVLAGQVRQLIAQMQEQIKNLLQQLKQLLARPVAAN